MKYLGFAVLFIMTALPAMAAVSTKLESFNYWTAYTFQENGQSVCYVASKPISEKGDYTKRGEVMMFVTHRPAKGERNVVNIMAGYPYQDKSSVTVTIDGKEKFTLFTEGEMAWTPDQASDDKLVNAMKKGGKMDVVGFSRRGTQTTDTYSLSGISKALSRIDQACR